MAQRDPERLQEKNGSASLELQCRHKALQGTDAESGDSQETNGSIEPQKRRMEKDSRRTLKEQSSPSSFTHPCVVPAEVDKVHNFLT
ncbi:unnamed protein product [Leuciscus chuanchicus]